MVREAGERMLVIPRPGRERDVERVFAKWELHGARIGEVIADERLDVRDAGETVASLPPKALADDAPEYDVREWAAAGPQQRNDPVAATEGGESPRPEGPINKIGLELLELMGSPDISSRAVLDRTYDQMVGTDTVVGPGADAAVLRLKGRPDGVALSLAAQPRVAAIDPFTGRAAPAAAAPPHLL